MADDGRRWRCDIGRGARRDFFHAPEKHVAGAVRSRATALAHMQNVKALLFDVFGTLVDWRSGVAREAQAVLSPLGIAIDCSMFDDAWRDQYQPAMNEVRTGRLPLSKLDSLHRR